MNGSPELLEFYLVEATEYIDALDQLVASASEPPDTNALLATARALRGSSTMAKVEPIAELSLVIEQIAIQGREPRFAWSPELYRALQTCVSDLRFLVRGVRVWSEREQTRVEARVADLRRFLPVGGRRPTPPSSESTTPVFVALQAAAIAAELDAFVTNPASRRSLDDAIARTRTMRGIAGISEYPPLADVAEAVDSAARRLMPDAPLSDGETELFRAAAALFRTSTEQLRSSGSRALPAGASQRFVAALAALDAPDRHTPTGARIQPFVPPQSSIISTERAPTPPESLADRMQQALVTRSEHLRRLLSEAREASDPVVTARLRRELRETTRELEAMAARLGAHQLSAFFAETGEAGDVLSVAELDALDAACKVTLLPFASLDELERRIGVIQRAPRLTPANAASLHAAAPRAHRMATPTGRELHDLLATGLEGFKSLDREPLSTPAYLGGMNVVPIEAILLRGPAALSRAIDLRDAWRQRGTPEDESLREIFDLLDLATSDGTS